MSQTLTIIKSRPNKTIGSAHKLDAGIDIFTPSDMKRVKLRPGHGIILPLGIKFDLPKGTMMFICNRTGVSTKEGIIASAQVVDEGFTGELSLGVRNISNKSVWIEPDTRYTQGVIFNYLKPNIKIVEETKEKPYKFPKYKLNDRGAGKFGSTGKK